MIQGTTVVEGTGTRERSGASSEVFDQTDRWLLNELQYRLPLARRPWDELGARRGLEGAAVLEHVVRLKRAGVIRQIGPIYDTAALGYASVLVAARVPDERIEASARVVSGHPGVSHNYRRDAAYNLWFTLAVPPAEHLSAHLKTLAAAAGFDSYVPLPALRTFHIGVRLDMTGKGGAARRVRHPAGTDAATHVPRKPVILNEGDRKIVRVTQNDLPLVAEPFDGMCRQLAMPFEALTRWMRQMQATGVMRRFAAILRHESAGFVAKGMVVWRVPDAAVVRAGNIAATFDQVSHAYQRPAHTDWPYNLYTMVHARSRGACATIVERIAAELGPLGVTEHRVLYSTRQYKKTRVRYFEPYDTTGAVSGPVATSPP